MYQVRVNIAIIVTVCVVYPTTDAIIQTINASLCSHVQLLCNSSINNPNPEYQWQHNGVIYNKQHHNITANGSSLTLHRINSTDFGWYYCWMKASTYGGTIVTKVLLQQTLPGSLMSWLKGIFSKLNFYTNSCSTKWSCFPIGL